MQTHTHTHTHTHTSIHTQTHRHTHTHTQSQENITGTDVMSTELHFYLNYYFYFYFLIRNINQYTQFSKSMRFVPLPWNTFFHIQHFGVIHDQILSVPIYPIYGIVWYCTNAPWIHVCCMLGYTFKCVGGFGHICILYVWVGAAWHSEPLA